MVFDQRPRICQIHIALLNANDDFLGDFLVFDWSINDKIQLFIRFPTIFWLESSVFCHTKYCFEL